MGRGAFSVREEKEKFSISVKGSSTDNEYHNGETECEEVLFNFMDSDEKNPETKFS